MTTCVFSTMRIVLCIKADFLLPAVVELNREESELIFTIFRKRETAINFYLPHDQDGRIMNTPGKHSFTLKEFFSLGLGPFQ